MPHTDLTTPPPASPWRIMDPVRGQIRLAMALAVLAALAGLCLEVWLTRRLARRRGPAAVVGLD